MRKTKLTLHIGMPKSGTTTIQKTLDENRETLSNLGIIYPQVGLRYRAHHLFADPLVQQKNVIRPDPEFNSEQLIASLMSFANSSYHIILSSETFASATKIYSPLETISKTFDLQIVIFFREQTIYAISQTNQHLKMRLYKPENTLDSVLERNVIPRSYVEIARLWRDSLPGAQISVVTLSPNNDSWQSFAETVNPLLSEIKPSVEVSNVSLDANAIAFIHWLCRTYREKSISEKNRLMSILSDYTLKKKKTSSVKQSLIPLTKLEEIQRISRPINEALAREFCDGYLHFGTPPSPFDFEYIDIRSISAEKILEVVDYVLERYDHHFNFLKKQTTFSTKD